MDESIFDTSAIDNLDTSAFEDVSDDIAPPSQVSTATWTARGDRSAPQVGQGGWFGGSHHHYLHHTIGFRHHCNFGGTWLFDGLFGTGYTLADEPATAGVPERSKSG